jgi:hypothetical protein
MSAAIIAFPTALERAANKFAKDPKPLESLPFTPEQWREIYIEANKGKPAVGDAETAAVLQAQGLDPAEFYAGLRTVWLATQIVRRSKGLD